MWRGWRCGTCPSRRSRHRGRRTPETHMWNINWLWYYQLRKGNKSVQTYQSLCDDGSRRRPGEDFDLTWGVDQHIPAEVKGHQTQQYTGEISYFKQTVAFVEEDELSGESSVTDWRKMFFIRMSSTAGGEGQVGSGTCWCLEVSLPRSQFEPWLKWCTQCLFICNNLKGIYKVKGDSSVICYCKANLIG